MRDYELRRGHWKNIDGEKLLQFNDTNGDRLIYYTSAFSQVGMP